VYVEIVAAWTLKNKTRISQAKMTKLWAKIKPSEVSYGFPYCVRNSIMSEERVTVPEVKDCSKYRFQAMCRLLRKTTDLYSAIKFKWWCSCDTDKSLCSQIQIVDKSPCWSIFGECGQQDPLRLQDARIQDSFHEPSHAYLAELDAEKNVWLHYSLLTNDYTTVLNKIKECWRKGVCIELRLLCKYNDNHQITAKPATRIRGIGSTADDQWCISAAHIGSLTRLDVTILEINQEWFQFNITSAFLLAEVQMCIPWGQIERIETHFSPLLNAMVIHVQPQWAEGVLEELRAALTTNRPHGLEFEFDPQNAQLFKTVISLEFVKEPPPSHMRMMSYYISRFHSNQAQEKSVIPRDADFIKNFLPPVKL